MSKQNNSEKWCTDCSFLVGCRLHICKNPDLEISGNFFSRKFLRLVSKSEFLGRILLLFFLQWPKYVVVETADCSLWEDYTFTLILN